MKKVFLILAAAVMAVGCERGYDGDETTVVNNNDNLVLTMSAAIETRGNSQVRLADVCSRLNVAVFDEAGTKVKTVAQTAADASFGTVGLSVAPGTYRVVIIAHNSNGSATITSPEKVTFPNNKVTDTFYYCGMLTATAERQDVSIGLQRVVAKLRLHMTGESLRSDIASFKFYYIGGSSTLSPMDGFGCVNSKQTEYRETDESGCYELYTIPHTTDDVLTRVVVTALDAADNVLGECELTDVPVTMNRVTDYTGDIFNGRGAMSIGLTVDAEWSGIDYYTF